jgi:hypothetical protein
MTPGCQSAGETIRYAAVRALGRSPSVEWLVSSIGFIDA